MFYLSHANANYKDEKVLKDISLNIAKGEKVALIGCSGSGKSTLLKLLYQQRSTDISLVPQEHGLVHSLSVFHNVYMGQLGRKPVWYSLINLLFPFKKSQDEVVGILSLIGLQDKMMQRVGELSGGQQQRTAIARALMQDSDVLFADEPISSLDETLSKHVMTVLTDRFKTVVLAMHDIDLALQFCDRIIGLKNGEVTLDKPSSELSRNDLLKQYGE